MIYKISIANIRKMICEELSKKSRVKKLNIDTISSQDLEHYADEAEKDMKSAQSRFDAAKRKLSKGQATLLDVAIAETDLETARANKKSVTDLMNTISNSRGKS